MRVLLDTHGLISALITDGNPRRLVRLVFAHYHTLALSVPLVEEFARIATDKRIVVGVGGVVDRLFDAPFVDAELAQKAQFLLGALGWGAGT